MDAGGKKKKIPIDVSAQYAEDDDAQRGVGEAPRKVFGTALKN